MSEDKARAVGIRHVQRRRHRGCRTSEAECHGGQGQDKGNGSGQASTHDDGTVLHHVRRCTCSGKDSFPPVRARHGAILALGVPGNGMTPCRCRALYGPESPDRPVRSWTH